MSLNVLIGNNHKSFRTIKIISIKSNILNLFCTYCRWLIILDNVLTNWRLSLSAKEQSKLEIALICGLVKFLLIFEVFEFSSWPTVCCKIFYDNSTPDKYCDRTWQWWQQKLWKTFKQLFSIFMVELLFENVFQCFILQLNSIHESVFITQVILLFDQNLNNRSLSLIVRFLFSNCFWIMSKRLVA